LSRRRSADETDCQRASANSRRMASRARSASSSCSAHTRARPSLAARYWSRSTPSSSAARRIAVIKLPEAKRPARRLACIVAGLAGDDHRWRREQRDLGVGWPAALLDEETGATGVEEAGGGAVELTERGRRAELNAIGAGEPIVRDLALEEAGLPDDRKRLV